MKRKLPADFQALPWITPDGALDLSKFPIDSILRQCSSENPQDFWSACMLLRSMSSERIEAGIFLLGLLRYHADDLTKLEVVVEGLESFHVELCATALFDELRRVKSSNATRRYLDRVLRTLARFPLQMVQDQLDALVQDRSFSPRMRTKFAGVLESMESKDAW